MTPADPLGLAAYLGQVLDSLGIPYVVGGSLASSIHGEPRLTVDLDIMIDVDEAKAVELVERLQGEFYADSEAARDAVRHESTFNVIHLASALKIDLFVAEKDQAVKRQFDRRVAIRIGESTVHVYAPEDIIVRKLRWFRLGGETSERQWRDVAGILRITGERIDFDYLEHAASHFGVGDLLRRARDDAK